MADEHSARTGHRLIATLGLLVYFSPYDKALQELFEALDGSPGFNLNGRGHIGNKLDIEVLALLTV